MVRLKKRNPVAPVEAGKPGSRGGESKKSNSLLLFHSRPQMKNSPVLKM